MEVCGDEANYCKVTRCHIFISTYDATCFSRRKKNSELADSARSAILIERDTGKILYEKNSNQELPCQYD